MRPIAELKVLAKRKRWAFEELTLDQKMIEANQMLGEVKKEWAYLKTRLQSGRAVLSVLVSNLGAYHKPVPQARPKVRLSLIVQRYPWVLGAIVVEEKHAEAMEMFASVNAMAKFLIHALGGQRELLESLRWLVYKQGYRRKTLCLRSMSTTDSTKACALPGGSIRRTRVKAGCTVR